MDGGELRTAPGRSARARRGTRRGGGLHARDPPRGDRRRHRQLPQASAHAARGEQRPLQRGISGGTGGAGGASRIRIVLDGVRKRDRIPDHGGPRAQLPGPSIRLRLLEARRRGVLPRAPRRARPPVHDLPALQRLRARRAAGRRAGDRARRAGPDSQGAVGPAPARDLRVGRADPDAHARGRHRGRHRHGHGESRGRERGLQHLRVRRAHRRRASPRSSGRRPVGIRRSSS